MEFLLHYKLYFIQFQLHIVFMFTTFDKELTPSHFHLCIGTLYVYQFYTFHFAGD